MQGVSSLGKMQNEHSTSTKLCYHSKITSTLLARDWKDKFNISNDPNEIKDSYNAEESDQSLAILLRKEGCGLKSQWLVAVFKDQKTLLLYTQCNCL